MNMRSVMLGLGLSLVPLMATAQPPQYDQDQGEPPAGYQCTAGRKVWVQMKPCPATYASSESVDVDGTTNEGVPFHGVGSVSKRLPVQQKSLDRDQLCALVDEGVSMGHKNIADDGYARNMTGCHG